MGRHSAGAPRDPEPQEPSGPPAEALHVPGSGAAFLGFEAPPAPSAPAAPAPPAPEPVRASAPPEPPSSPVAPPPAAVAPPAAPAAPAGLPGALGTIAPPTVVPRPAAPKLDDVAPSGSVRRGEDRTRAGRKRLLLTLAVVVALLAVGAGITTLVTGGGKATRTTAGTTPGQRTQRTLLVVVGADTSSAVGVLLAEDQATKTASMTLLPSRLLVNVAGRGTLALGRTFSTLDPTVAQDTVADTMGIIVDGTWSLESQGFTQLVDQLGGLTLDVDADVVTNGQVVVNAGAGQRLDGPKSLAFLQALGAEQDESVRLGHVGEVVDAVLKALPSSAQPRTDLLGSLGSQSSPSIGVTELATFLAGVGQSPDSAILPVSKLDSGGATASYRVDARALKGYVSRVLQASVPDTHGKPVYRVFVFNGTGTPNLGARIRPKLVAAGLSLVGSQNAATFDRTQTLVVIKDSSAAQRAAGDRVLAALGLPQSALRIGSEPSGVADVFVEVGSDLKL